MTDPADLHVNAVVDGIDPNPPAVTPLGTTSETYRSIVSGGLGEPLVNVDVVVPLEGDWYVLVDGERVEPDGKLQTKVQMAFVLLDFGYTKIARKNISGAVYDWWRRRKTLESFEKDFWDLVGKHEEEDPFSDDVPIWSVFIDLAEKYTITPKEPLK